MKSTLDVKEEHLPDVAIQLHVLRKAGLDVKRAELMHLNRDCRYPDLSTLFQREAVTSRLRPWLRVIPDEITTLRRTLSGSLPVVATGAHCHEPHDCPFLERCWPPLPPNHITTLYRIRNATVEKLLTAGYATLLDLPRRFKARGPARRQLRSVRRGEMIVERGLRRALAAFRPPVAYLDFETVSPAIPVWPGCRPYDVIPAQFSCHMPGPHESSHQSWLADGPGDPRRAFAEALLAACKGARTIVAYNASFERRCIDALTERVPGLEPAPS